MLIHRSAFHLHRIAADDPRYALAGIRIEADGTAVVTDGHRLVRVKAKGPDDSEFPEIEFDLAWRATIPLEVQEENIGARRLYSRLGFGDYAPGADNTPTLFLEKKL